MEAGVAVSNLLFRFKEIGVKKKRKEKRNVKKSFNIHPTFFFLRNFGFSSRRKTVDAPRSQPWVFISGLNY